MSLAYRRDVDGLRAVAVVPVVLFHAFPEWIGGGYVGVDVFFVISGFLITGLLMSDLDKGRFSLLHFYERRARRILPALTVVLLFCLAVTSVLYLPEDFRRFCGSLLATGVFASNLFFWKTTGYFATEVDIQPLLHTWSLAVEEQFYLFFPLLLALVCLRWRRALVPVLASIFVLSLAASAVLTRGETQSFAFYMLPTRAWELMLGSLLAVGAIRPSANARLNVALAWTGLALILFAVFRYSAETAFPGVAALAPALGAALIIYAGMGGAQPLRAFLEWRPVVGIGLISYSLYLWHWPVLAMLRYYTMDAPAVLPLVAAIAFSTLAAAASWRWVENPVRRQQVFPSRRAVFQAAIATIAATVALGVVGVVTQGAPQRLPAEVASMVAPQVTKALRSKDRSACLSVTPERMRAGDLCIIGERREGTGPSFLLWGDSHAETFRGPLSELATAAGEWGYFAGGSGCPPLVGMERQDRDAGEACRPVNDAIVGWMREQGIRKVVLAARWALNVEGTRYRTESGSPVVLSPAGIEENPKVVLAALRATLLELEAAGIQTWLVSGVPEIGMNVPRILALQRHLARKVAVAPTRDQFLDRNRDAIAVLEQASAGIRGVTVLYPDQILCPAGTQVCQVERDGQPLYVDDDHLSLTGARYIEPLFTPVFARPSSTAGTVEAVRS